MARPVKIDRARFAVVAGENIRRALFSGRKRIANAGHVFHQLLPADLFTEIAVVLCTIIFHQRELQWSNRQEESGDDDDVRAH